MTLKPPFKHFDDTGVLGEDTQLAVAVTAISTISSFVMKPRVKVPMSSRFSCFSAKKVVFIKCNSVFL